MSSSEVSAELQALLARARRGLSPSEKDAERNFTGTLARLEVPLNPGGELPGELYRPASEALGRTTSTVRRLLPGVGIAAVFAGLGYLAGERAGFERARDASVPVEAAGLVVSVAKSSTARAVDVPAAPPQTSQDAAAKPSDLLRPPASAALGPAAGQSTLEEELRMLRRVERAQRQGNARLALSLLDELDQSAPNGVLGEERFAARTMARCALGYGSREALHSAFVGRHPGSVYAARVANACAARDAGGEKGD